MFCITSMTEVCDCGIFVSYSLLHNLVYKYILIGKSAINKLVPNNGLNGDYRFKESVFYANASLSQWELGEVIIERGKI